jgi:hypothetical protein
MNIAAEPLLTKSFFFSSEKMFTTLNPRSHSVVLHGNVNTVFNNGAKATGIVFSPSSKYSRNPFKIDQTFSRRNLEHMLLIYSSPYLISFSSPSGYVSGFKISKSAEIC